MKYKVLLSFLLVLLLIRCGENEVVDETMPEATEEMVSAFTDCPIEFFSVHHVHISKEKRKAFAVKFQADLSSLKAILQEKKPPALNLEASYSKIDSVINQLESNTFLGTEEAINFNMFSQLLCNLWNLSFHPQLEEAERQEWRALFREKIMDLSLFVTELMLNSGRKKVGSSTKPVSNQETALIRILVPVSMQYPKIEVDNQPAPALSGSGPTALVVSVPKTNKPLHLKVSKGNQHCERNFQLDPNNATTISFPNCN